MRLFGFFGHWLEFLDRGLGMELTSNPALRAEPLLWGGCLGFAQKQGSPLMVSRGKEINRLFRGLMLETLAPSQTLERAVLQPG